MPGLIRALFVAGHGTYGARRVLLDIREAGETSSEYRLARVMRVNNVRVRRGYRARRRPGTAVTEPLFFAGPQPLSGEQMDLLD